MAFIPLSLWLASPSSALARSDDLDLVAGPEGGARPRLPRHEITIERGRDGLLTVAELCDQLGQRRSADLAALAIDEHPSRRLGPMLHESLVRCQGVICDAAQTDSREFQIGEPAQGGPSGSPSPCAPPPGSLNGVHPAATIPCESGR